MWAYKDFADFCMPKFWYSFKWVNQMGILNVLDLEELDAVSR